MNFVDYSYHKEYKLTKQHNWVIYVIRKDGTRFAASVRDNSEPSNEAIFNFFVKSHKMFDIDSPNLEIAG